MDFVNKAYSQSVELFRSMTPAGRITTVLLLTAVVVSLVYLFQQQTDKADEYLFGAEVLTQGEIATLETAFAKAKLSHWDSTGNRIRVPRSQKHTYMAAAAEENAIPASFSSSYQTLFAQSNWSDPRDTRLLKANFALEQFLAQTLRKMSTIEEARVKINETAGEGFPQKKERRAFVAVKTIGQKRLTHEQIQTIRWTVAGGANVDETGVTVTDLNGIAYPGASKDGDPHSYDNVYTSRLREFINIHQQQISDALTPMYPGVQVAVNVELDKELRHQTTSLKYDDKPTALNSTEYTKDTSSIAKSDGGRPGAAANGVNSNKSAQVASTEPSNQSTTKENREDKKNLVGTTQTLTQKATLTPESITAAIGIPTSYFVKVWHQNHPPAAGEAPKSPPPDELKQIETDTIRNIEEIVRPMLRYPAGSDSAFKPITVVAYTELPAPMIEEPTFAKTAGAWFAENWQSLGMFGLAVAGVIFLRSMIRASQQAPLDEHAPAREATGIASGQSDPAEAHQDEDSNESAAAKLKHHFQSSGRSLRDELTDLVKEDPDAAANILKLWISDAA